MRKKATIIFCVMFVLRLLTYFLVPKGTVTTSSAIYPSFTKTELVNDSDLIVKAKIEEISDSKYANPNFELGDDIPNVIVTDVLVSTETVYKGSVSPGDNIKIRTEGGKVGKDEYVNEDMPSFQTGDQVILFLSFPRAGEDNKIITKDYYVFNPVQGVYFPGDSADGGQTFKAYGSDDTLNLSTLQVEIDALLKSE